MNESSIEIGKSEEGLNPLDCCGFWPVQYSLDLALVHSYSVDSDNVSQELDFLLVEFAFLRFKQEANSS